MDTVNAMLQPNGQQPDWAVEKKEIRVRAIVSGADCPCPSAAEHEAATRARRVFSGAARRHRRVTRQP